MIGLDTNILVRFLTQDDPQQFKEAADLLAELERQHRTAHISIITVCETVWVLARAYKIERVRIADTLEQLLDTALFNIEDKDLVREAVGLYRVGKGDIADYLLGLRSRAVGCATVATFDGALHAHPKLFASPAKAGRVPRRASRG